MIRDRRLSAALAVIGGVVLVTPAVAIAATPPPPGAAQAVAAQVGTIVALSRTSAGAGPAGPSSAAAPVELGGQPPSSGFGGRQKGPGKSSGHLVDSGKSPVAQVQVTPWSASGEQSGDSSKADAEAALARIILGDGALTVNVVQSSSHATYNGAASTGASSSDGATVHASGLDLVLLHSEASSSGKGFSEVAGINGNGVLTSGDTNGSCVLTVPGLLMLNCLTASGGVGHAVAGVLDATLGSGSSGLSAAAFQSSASGLDGTSATRVLAEPPLSRPAPSPALDQAAVGRLPRTGIAVTFAAAVGVALILLGLVLTVPFRVRRLALAGAIRSGG
jgi:hypothetical protein